MKKRRFLASIVLIVSTLAVVTSCQQDEENISSGKSSLRYLSVADGYLDDVSFYPNDSNTVNYREAIERLLGFSDKGVYAKAASASEVNMSQELYDYLTSSFISPKIKTRTNSDDDKTLSENDYDCVACTIAEVYCELACIMDYKTKKRIYKQAWELICRVNGQEGLLWGINGWGYFKILRACFENVEQFVRPNAEEIYHYLKEPSMKVIGVIEVKKDVYHSVEIVFIDPETGYIMYKDNQTHEQNVTNVSDLKGAFRVSVPTGDNFVSRYNML